MLSMRELRKMRSEAPACSDSLSEVQDGAYRQASRVREVRLAPAVAAGQRPGCNRRRGAIRPDVIFAPTASAVGLYPISFK